MKPQPETGQRFRRDPSLPRLAEAPSAEAREDDLAGLLDRLEQQAAESGRLEGQVSALERALKSEREARRRLGKTLQRERAAAFAIHQRAERDRAELASATEELERLREALAGVERQLQMSWAQLAQAEQQLAGSDRPRWRKLIGDPPL